jgi:hypothetical protein
MDSSLSIAAGGKIRVASGQLGTNSSQRPGTVETEEGDRLITFVVCSNDEQEDPDAKLQRFMLQNLVDGGIHPKTTMLRSTIRFEDDPNF